jgi:hypothetical protein
MNTIIGFGFHKAGQFLVQLSDYQLLRKNFATWINFVCGSHNDAFCCSEYAESNNRIINE